MNQILTICDTLGKYDRETNLPFGHYLEIFRQYAQLLGDVFCIQVATTMRYTKFLDTNLKIREFTYLQETPCNIPGSKLVKGLADKKKYVIHFFNMIKCLNLKTDILIFQSYPSVIYFLPLLFYRGHKKIIQIVYKNIFLGTTSKNSKTVARNYLVSRFLKAISHCFKSVIASTEETASFFHNVGIPAVVMPDYLKSEQETSDTHTPQYLYDLAIMGTNSIHKNLMDVVNSFKNTKVSVIIAGKFTNDALFKEVTHILYKNIKVVNQYLSPKDYQDIIQNSRYIAFPYSEHNYTSGVFFEALYNSKPILCSETLFADDVKKNNMGFVYKKSIIEFLDQHISMSEYKFMQDNIKKYVKLVNKEAKARLLNFLFDGEGASKDGSTTF